MWLWLLVKEEVVGVVVVWDLFCCWGDSCTTRWKVSKVSKNRMLTFFNAQNDRASSMRLSMRLDA